MTAGLNMLKNVIDSAEEKEAEETIEVISLHLSAESISKSMGFTMLIEDRRFPQPLHLHEFQRSVMSELNDLMADLRAERYLGLGVIELIFNVRVLDPRGGFDFTLKCADFPIAKTLAQDDKVAFELAQETKRGLHGIISDLAVMVFKSRGLDIHEYET